MTRFSAALVAATLLTSCLPVYAVPEPNTVGYSFSKRHLGKEEASQYKKRNLRKRADGTVQATIDNGLVLYLINVTVGTPGQPFSLQLDTGSSDLWFPSENANVCQQDANNCPFGTFSARDSSSLHVYNDLPEFQIEYVDGTQVQGQFISDVLNIGSTKLTNVTMAAATSLNELGVGIMGVGFDFGEASAQLSGFTYPNVINVLQSEGFINRRAYSLWLDDITSNTGSILFGGVDTSKYHGDLVALPIQPDSRTNQIESFTVAWTGLTVSGSGNKADMSPQQPTAAILDSGSTIMLLPDDIANNILSGVGASIDRQYGAVVPCNLGNDDLSFNFEFGGSGGAKINISVAEFVTPIFLEDGSIATLTDGSQACTFGVQGAGDNPIIFGDTFLRAAYVVYDLENQVIGLAQTNFDAGNPDVQAFDASASGIPGVTSTATVAASQTFTGVPRETAETGASGSVQATGGSATFQLSATGGSGAAATSSGVAAGDVRPLITISGTSILAGFVVLAGVVFGGGLMLV
jgi:hypothetical protein